MLFKISVNNLRKSVRDYAIYFFTLIIGVSIFYVFNAIGEQAAFMKVSQSTREMIELLKTTLSGISVFVSVVLGLLIVYASRFLMKRRNREFAIYLMLGMGKGNISLLLLMETLMIGIGSLVIGLLVGIGLSQVMSALVASLFEADMSAYRFMVSGEAIGKTVLYFGVMYVVVMLFNGVMIGRCRLITLLQSGKTSEKMKLKNPVLCVVIFVVACAALGYAYYQVGWHGVDMLGRELAVMIVIGAVSTFLIFWSVSGLLLRIVMSVKHVYYRGLNSFTFRQISSKVNTMVLSMTVICLMLFVTICTLSASFSVRNSMNANLKELCRADFEVDCVEYEEDDLTKVYKDVEKLYEQYGYDLKKYFGDYVHFHDYADANFTLATALGEQLNELMQQYRYLQYDRCESIVKLSDYNKLMEFYGKDKEVLSENEFILLCDFKSMKVIRDEVLKSEPEITVFGKRLQSKYRECRDGYISISAQHMNTGVYIVPDEVVDEACAGQDYFIGNYAADNKNGKAKIERKVRSDYEKVVGAYTREGGRAFAFTVNTRIDIGEAAIGLGAMVTFLGLYIGLVFLVSCGAILALKELSESVDSISRYEMLRKIGVEEKDISSSLFRQTGIFFLLPLLLACIHSVFGMKFSVRVLEIFGTEKLAESIGATSVILLAIYGGYFLITYFCGRGIIRGQR